MPVPRQTVTLRHDGLLRGLVVRGVSTSSAAVARAGDADRAEVIAGSLTDPYWQPRALAGVSEAVAESGDVDRARLTAQRAEVIARSVTDPDQAATGELLSLIQLMFPGAWCAESALHNGRISGIRPPRNARPPWASCRKLIFRQQTNIHKSLFRSVQ